MNKIIFITDNFTPETNAPASRTHDHCREWVKKGAYVTVITSFPNFPEGKIHKGYKNTLKKTEIIDGIKVIRLWSFIRPNKGFILRVLDHISFAITAFIYLLFVKRKSYDAIIATSPQFFVGLTAMFISKLKTIPWFIEIRDLWPEGIILIKKDSLIYKFLEKIEFLYYHYSTGIITVTSSYKSNIIKRFNIPEDKIAVIYNGSNNKLFKPTEKSILLAKEIGLQYKFIFGYAGTIGVSHALDFILNCSKEIYNFDERIHFLFIGSGAEYENIQSLIKTKGLTNVSLLPSVRKEEVPNYLSIFDCGLVNLKKFEGYLKVIPSKIFELAAMKKPILLGVQGESKSILNRYNAGLCFEPENKIEFIQCCKKLFIEDLKQYEQGLCKLSQDFDRKVLANKMYEFIKQKI